MYFHGMDYSNVNIIDNSVEDTLGLFFDKFDLTIVELNTSVGSRQTDFSIQKENDKYYFAVRYLNKEWTRLMKEPVQVRLKLALKIPDLWIKCEETQRGFEKQTNEIFSSLKQFRDEKLAAVIRKRGRVV